MKRTSEKLKLKSCHGHQDRVVRLDPGNIVFRSLDDPGTERRIDVLYRSGGATSSLTEEPVRDITSVTATVLDDGLTCIC